MTILKFGKYEGKEIGEIVKDIKGREYLAWLVGQPVKEDRWKQANEERNEEIRGVLASFSSSTPQDKTALMVATLEEIIERLTHIKDEIQKS